MPLYGGLEHCQRVGSFNGVWEGVPEANGARKERMQMAVNIGTGYEVIEFAARSYHFCLVLLTVLH